MKLLIDNIGPFSGENEIVLDGITILAGINGTGKSTFGKVLYSLFSTFFDIEAQIYNERQKSIRRTIWNYLREENVILRQSDPLARLSKKLIDSITDIEGLEESVDEILKEESIPNNNQKRFEALKKRIVEALQLDDKILIDRLLQYRINAEFDDQILNLQNSGYGAKATLDIKGNTISFKVDEKKINVNTYFPLIKRIIYIDDPAVLDKTFSDMRYIESYSHSENLGGMLASKGDDDFSSVDQILIEGKLKLIEEKINAVCDGEIRQSNNGYRYVSSDFAEGLSFINMAAGLKSFVILKDLLLKGYLEENGVVIFDEPEIHLHPEWQKVLAEIIVLLNKELGINVLLSTHSSDFLAFLELYRNKYNVKEGYNVYLLKKSDNSSVISEVGENWDKIYGQLGEPFLRATEELEHFDTH